MVQVMQWSIGSFWSIDGKHIGREKGKMYDAVIVDLTSTSRASLQVILKITASVRDLSGKEISQTWQHNKPISIDKLRKPLLKGEI